jgi:cyclase
MPLAKRVIPVLLVRGHQLVKGKQFQSWRSVGLAEQAARIYARRGVDELVILDIAATPEGRGPDFSMVERMTAGNFCPVSVGGGVRSVEDVRNLLNAGADKVIIGTHAVRSSLIRECTQKFGSQAITVSIDYRNKIDERGFHRLPSYLMCGTHERLGTTDISDSDAFKYMRWAETCGAGEILFQCIDRDGMMDGYDLLVLKAISGILNIPVIASGGCGTYEHMYEAIQAGADAVAAGSMFLFTDATPAGAAAYLAAKGVPCRQ